MGIVIGAPSPVIFVGRGGEAKSELEPSTSKVEANRSILCANHAPTYFNDRKQCYVSHVIKGRAQRVLRHKLKVQRSTSTTTPP